MKSSLGIAENGVTRHRVGVRLRLPSTLRILRIERRPPTKSTCSRPFKVHTGLAERLN